MATILNHKNVLIPNPFIYSKNRTKATANIKKLSQ